MRKLSLILLAVCAVLIGTAQHASAQYFNYTTDFETPTGTHVVNAFSIDTNSALGINDIVINGGNTQPAGASVNLYTFATNSQTSTGGSFNYPYRISITLVPANSAGTALTGYTAITQYITGTITGTLNLTTNTLTNTYNNLVSTPSGQAEVLNYTFTAAGMPTQTFQVQALANGFIKGGPGNGTAGSAGALVVSTPEPGSLALFFGMGLSGALLVRRRLRRK